MSERYVVLGASGGIGHALVTELLRQGRRTRAVSRHTPDVSAEAEVMSADLSTLEGARRACADASVVFHAAQPAYHRWPEEFPGLTANIITAASEAGAKLVMADNLYMYGPVSEPLVESLPRAATGRKGVARARMEVQLLDAHQSGAARVAIGRMSDYYGPHGPNSTLAALVFNPAAKGKTMRWPGSTTAPKTLHFLPDTARGLIVLADHDAADGQVWHIPAAQAITGNEFMALINQCLETSVKTASMSEFAMRIGGLFSKAAKESVECMYQWTDPFVIDSAKFINAFGPFTVTPHANAIATTIASLNH